MSLLQPTDDLQALRHHMNRLFDENGRGAGDAGNSVPRVWAPAVDVAETAREIVLHAELPGMKKEEIDIQLTGDTLTIRGERRRSEVGRGENFHRIERQHGAFGRTFQIETPIDAPRVSAAYENGVLTIRLPKQEKVQPRQIAIDVK